MNDTRYPEMVSLREAAARTGLSYYFLRNACHKGEIPFIWAGRSLKVNFSKLSEMLNSVQRGDEDGSVRIG